MTSLLVIDTCGPVGLVALVDAGLRQTRAQRTIGGRETQERLMGAVAEVLSASGTDVRQLAAVAVITGPGSFTGVRIGVAAAKGLVEAGGLPLVACSRLAVLAHAAAQRWPGETVTAWLDAGRTDVYAGQYVLGQGPLPRRIAEEMLPREVALRMLEACPRLVVEDAALAALWPGALLLSAEDAAGAACSLATAAWHAGEFADAALLQANYLRVPDAELALRARQAAERSA